MNNEKINTGLVGACVLIATNNENEEMVLTQLIENENKNGCVITSVHPIYNPNYSLLVNVDATNYSKIGDFVVNYIRNIPGVENTMTLNQIKR